MKSITITTTAASLDAGNSQKQKQSAVLAIAWLYYCDHPENEKPKERFARALQQSLFTALPDGMGYGQLKDKEGEIRQESILLLLSRYLAGNADLILATKKANLAAIKNQLQRSIFAAVQATSRSLLRSIERERKRYEYRDSIDEHPRATCLHPAERTTLWQLPYEAQLGLVFGALRIAVEEKLLPEKNLRLVMTMLKAGLSQAQIALSLGISRQAVHQRIEQVRNHLRKQIDKQEFPLA